LNGRTDITVWSLAGQSGFAAAFGRALGCRVYTSGEIPPCDVVHVVGMFDCPTFATTLHCTRAARRRVYHWTGPDAANRFWRERIPEGLHVCPSEQVRVVLARNQIDAAIVAPPVRVHAPVTRFTGSPVVAVYGGMNPSQYGMGMAQALYECLPGVTFLSYAKDQFSEGLMPEVIARSNVYVRLRRVSDGHVSSREYLAAGRRVVSTEELEYVTHVERDDLPGVLAAVKAALGQTEPHTEAAGYWTARNCDERFAEELERLL
jgi:hypothetical protein